MATFIGGIAFIISYTNMIISVELDKDRSLKLENDLKILSGFQQNLLPKHIIIHKNEIDFAAINIPARDVGGDFYDIIETEKNLICSVGDVAGKALPAAFYMYMSYTATHTLMKSETPSKLS